MRKISGKINVNFIKISLIAVLTVLELLVIMDYYGIIASTGRYGEFFVVLGCGLFLAVLEGVNAFLVKNFAGKMVFYVIDSILIFIISMLTGFAYLAALYCIILTECYICIDRFRDRTILFLTSTALFIISFVAGWVISNEGTGLYDSFVSIMSGSFIGVLAIVVDYAVMQFIIKFLQTNRELTAALQAEAESKAALDEAYEQLTKTKVFEERNRIAKDIHDNAGHSMTTVIMQTEAAKLLIDTDPQEAKKRIISANIQARNALDSMRESVHLLAGRGESRPVKAEIDEIIAQTVDGTSMKARLDIDEVELAGDELRFVLNTVKELLANGIRHGGASAFYVELKTEGKKLRLVVSDNGSGVDGAVKEGFGLSGIRQKAEALGGSVSFSGQPGDGFESEIILPLESENNKDTEVKND